MRLTIVGCAGSFPGPDSPASCYLLEADGFAMLLDLGNGSLGALQQHVDLFEVDAICLSHLHADHCLDLCSYQVVRTYSPRGAVPPIPVYGPAGTAERMARAYGTPDEPGVDLAFDFPRLAPGVREMGPFLMTTDRVEHPVETYGFRVEYGGRAVCYSGDTGVSSALVELARGVDLLLCEASFPDVPNLPAGMHLTGRQAAEHAADAEVGKLVLTHLVPWHDSERIREDADGGGYRGPIELARSGAVYQLG